MISTISGHVSRAIDLYQHTDLWLALGRRSGWDQARLTGYAIGPFTAEDDETFSFKARGADGALYTVSLEITVDDYDARVASGVASDLNNAAVTASGGQITTIASVVDNRIRLTAPAPGVGLAYIEIVTGSVTLGFLTGEVLSATTADDEVPAPSPEIRHLVEPFAFKKISTKNLVIPNADTPAVLVGSVQGTAFNTTSMFGMEFRVDDTWDVAATFDATATTSIVNILDAINTAAYAVSPDLAEVAQIDGSVSPPRIKLVSPTLGSDSMIEITETNSAIGFGATSIVTGLDGGSIRFRQDQFEPVDLEDAFERGARMVYMAAEFLYDEFPIVSGETDRWTQVGLLSRVVPKVGFEARDRLEFHEVADFGVLEMVDFRAPTPRSGDQKEEIRIVVEL